MQHQAKKSMGQNFLKSEPALNMMCEAGRVNSEDTIVEIGPGKGALTSKLLAKAGKVIAIEKDRELIKILEEKFRNEIKENKLEIVEGDCLLFEFPLPLLRGGQGEVDLIKNLPSIPSLLRRGGTPQPYKIIANIPYNITGAIIKKFLSEDKFKPTLMTLLVQKEVAERIVARDNKESILSLSVRAYGEPKYVMKVHKRFFSPSPKVDSAIILIDNISNKNFKDEKEEKLFFEIIKTGFAHKRKVLIKNMEVGLPYISNIKEKLEEIFKKLEINPKARAEDLKFSTWIEILHLLSTNI